MLKIWHYLKYKSHFYLCIKREANVSFGSLRSLMEFFLKFCRFVKCYKCAWNDDRVSLLYADIF